MAAMQTMLLLISTFFSALLFSYGQSASNVSAIDSVDSIIRDRAFDILLGVHTGVIYDVPLPANLSGIEASMMRLRSRTFWRRGANITAFRIPPRTLPVPQTRRFVVVYQNWNNWSSSYFNVPGYTLLSPVISLLAYDASNASFGGAIQLAIQFNLRSNDTIAFRFPKVAMPSGSNSSMKCAWFGLDGSVHLDKSASLNSCTTRSMGHFAIVEPSKVSINASASSVRSTKEKVIRVVVVLGSGVVGIAVLGVAVVGVTKLVKKRKLDKMVRRSEEGQVLENVWVGGSKMPSAAMRRTEPVIESEEAP
uniref:Legume lectin domain-containing protein n=1 Tax=Ananas comosus var. bracteatus TaxID=296719 RepID=A0A6V7PTF3_ANACO|nr:unnamed protein product [Ananas comosus var. bracteatus]